MHFFIKLFLFLILPLNASYANETEKKFASDADVKSLEKAVEDVFKYYENGSHQLLQQKFDPTVVGVQKLINAVSTESARCKQIRVNLNNTKITVGTDIAAVQTGWEKRCLLLPNLNSQLQTGQGSFLMHKTAFGWRIAGITGTMPFSSIKIPTSLTASTTTTCTTIMSTSVVAISLPFTITVSDPNRAKQSSIQVQLTSGTDSENLTLNAATGETAGTFKTTTILGKQGSGIPNNGSLEVLVSGGSCSSVRISYTSSSVVDGVKSNTATVNFQ